ncbi:hypothetical protein Dip510_001266 [Elusimicrobium posterum]|uniref:hypothetical protein n=1 Tax=Elusimicrobium posterum TaxID=3116653 RepID=UPI003C767C11
MSELQACVNEAQNEIEEKKSNSFYNIVAAFAKHLATVILPYIIGSMAVFLGGLYALYTYGIAPAVEYGWLRILIIILLVIIYGAFSFFYGVVMAGLSTLKSIGTMFEDFLNEFVAKVKASFEKKVNNMQDGIPKTQAKILLNRSFKEVVQTYKDNKASSSFKAITVFILSFVVFVTGKMLIGRFKETSGLEIGPGLIFAGGATLVGAVFFNLNLFATFLLAMGYCFGLAVVVLPVVFVVF